MQQPDRPPQAAPSQPPAHSRRRDWIIIAGLVGVVVVSWTGFLLFWLHRQAPVSPPQTAAVPAPAPQATRPASSQPYALLDPSLLARPAPQSRPAPPAPASQPLSRDAVLLEALQRSQQLKAEGKPREALAELQRALHGDMPADPAAPPADDPQAQLGNLLSQLGQSGSSSQPAGNDALLTAALQILGNSAGELSEFMEDLERDTGGRGRGRQGESNRPAAAAGAASPAAAAPAAAEVVAYVHGQPVTRQDIVASGEGPTNRSVARLNDRILQPLLEVYSKEQGLKATPADIQTYLRLTGPKQPVNRPPPRPAYNRQQGRPALPPPDPAAEAAVLAWKASRALYETYGGAVIEDSSGRLEPVGAYARFLREQQAKAAFRFADARYEQRFWAYYDQDFSHKAVPPEKVNFTRPWWIRPVAPAAAEQGGGRP